MVRADRKRLVQVVANVLTNAAKYTHEGGRILLRAEAQRDDVVLSVTDNGIGMEPELTGRVFEVFAQAARSSDRSMGGLGLGLALVKSLVSLHGGKVTSFSEGPGQGSTFTVCLPHVQDVLHAIQSEPHLGDLPVASRRLRVMVVDDNVDAAQMLATLVEAMGHEVAVEYGSRPALERALLEKPDVCLFDVGLPDLDGNELARRLRATLGDTQMCLVAVTGYGQDNDRDATAKAGFDQHFVKPVDAERLGALFAEVARA
jgi:CheY-like chemotaxis protein